MRYHHLGIPTANPQPGETYLAQYKMFCTDHERNPFGIQWMRYEPGCPLPELVRTVPHVAFEVDDLAAALVGHEILIEPNSPSEGVLVAFVVCDGAPVEFLEIAGSRGRFPALSEFCLILKMQRPCDRRWPGESCRYGGTRCSSHARCPIFATAFGPKSGRDHWDRRVDRELGAVD